MNKIEITNNAQEYIASVLEKDSARYFRITVLGGGCAILLAVEYLCYVILSEINVIFCFTPDIMT